MSARPAGAIRPGEAASIPAGADPKTFLSFYSERFDTVELNTTGYRLPAEGQFERWAEQTPPGFTFAVKMPLTRLDRVADVRRTGAGARRPARARSASSSRARATTACSSSSSARCRRSCSSRGTFAIPRGTTSTASSASTTSTPSRFATSACASRLTPTMTCSAVAERIRPPAFVYFRHEDEPSAPDYARRLAQITR